MAKISLDGRDFDIVPYKLGASGAHVAMLSTDTFGNGVPISSGSWQAALQDARRDESGSAERQQQRF